MSPLTPSDLDLRDFPYMPMDVVRLRDSESAVMCSGEEFRAAVLLWCAAWHQVPAASLPDDDRLLANLAGFGRDVEAWKAVREGALRSFILCDDGRLYHPVIAEKANEAETKRKAHADKMDKARAALAAKRASITETIIETKIETNKGLKGREGKGNKDGADAPDLDSDKQLFERGTAVVGKEHRSLIAKLKKSLNGDIRRTRAVVEAAATKAAPLEYIGAAIRGDPSTLARAEYDNPQAGII